MSFVYLLNKRRVQSILDFLLMLIKLPTFYSEHFSPIQKVLNVAGTKKFITTSMTIPKTDKVLQI